MTIQTLLLDILKQCNIAKIDVLKISSLPDQKLRIQTYDADRVLFIDATTHDSYPEFTGEFGLFNFKILKGLLTLSSFQSDSATFTIGTRKIDGKDYPDRIEFKGGGSKATFRMMSKEVVPEQPTIVNIPWDITLNPSPSKLAEFQQMAGLYSDVEGLFTVSTQDDNLIVDFGTDSASTHSATMTLAEEINGSLVSEMRFPIDKFTMLMKSANDANASDLKFTSKGLLGVIATTDHATYNYYVKKSL